MNEIIPFEFEKKEVRIVVIQGSPWFVAKDVADILGYDATNDMTKWLDKDEKGANIVRTLGGNQRMVVISEPGLYNCIMRSKSKKVTPFRRWVTHEVLPSIRKTGSYTSPIKQDQDLNVVVAGIAQAMTTMMDTFSSFMERMEKKVTELQANPGVPMITQENEAFTDLILREKITRAVLGFAEWQKLNAGGVWSILYAHFDSEYDMNIREVRDDNGSPSIIAAIQEIGMLKELAGVAQRLTGFPCR